MDYAEEKHYKEYKGWNVLKREDLPDKDYTGGFTFMGY